MRCIINPPNFNTRNNVPARRGFDIAERNSTGSFSASYWVFAAVLILVTCAPATGSAYESDEPNWPTSHPQGSSGRKSVIEIRTSPGVYLPGPTFRIQVTSAKPVTHRVLEFLQQSIEQTLLRNDPRLSVASTAPNTSIVFNIIDLALSPGPETRIRQEYQQTGFTTITDPATGVSRYEPQYAWVDVAYRALVLEARMSVKCEVTDVATGILLYSDRFDAVYTDARDIGFGPGSASVDDLNGIYLKLAENATGLILAQLSPRVYSEIVALPSGKLMEAAKLMEASLWREALTLLTSTPVFKNPKDDAYRFYSIGVTHEALAYKALDYFEKKRQLERAVDNYQRAVELKPNENMFWAPKYRAEFVLLKTSGLVAQVEVFEEAKKPGSKTASNPDRISTDLFRDIRSRMPSGPRVIDNQTVVQWVRSGRSSDYITASIRHAPGTRFDLSEAEVLKLRRDGVNKSVIKAMTKSQATNYPVFGRWKAIFLATSLLWWLPWVFAR